MMRCRNANLVNPEFRARLIGVQIDDPRHEADDRIPVDRYHQAMTRIVEERSRRARVERIIEHIRRDVGENAAIVRSEEFDIN